MTNVEKSLRRACENLRRTLSTIYSNMHIGDEALKR
jgi:hypothetical protein